MEAACSRVTLAPLLRTGPPPSSKRFFLSVRPQPGFKRFWHVLLEVGVFAFAPFGPLTAASGLARSRPAHVQGAASSWRTLGLSAFFPKTSDRYRVLCLIFPVCHKTEIGLPQLPSFGFPSHEQTLVLVVSLFLILRRRSSWILLHIGSDITGDSRCKSLVSAPLWNTRHSLTIG